jgi:hypothetical protein
MLQHLLLFAQGIDTTNLPHAPATDTQIKTIISIVLSVLGGVSVIMVVIGGIQYAGSQGDPQATAKAKNTIIYSLVGVAIALFAVFMVQYVIGKLFS